MTKLDNMLTPIFSRQFVILWQRFLIKKLNQKEQSLSFSRHSLPSCLQYLFYSIKPDYPIFNGRTIKLIFLRLKSIIHQFRPTCKLSRLSKICNAGKISDQISRIRLVLQCRIESFKLGKTHRKIRFFLVVDPLTFDRPSDLRGLYFIFFPCILYFVA